ncbi:MAG: thioredoxin domain-containing protein [Bdellovibrionales bacterium]|nr:thioredoxin domain-containing protein [Bdellovibrionales bacterium]
MLKLARRLSPSSAFFVLALLVGAGCSEKASSESAVRFMKKDGGAPGVLAKWNGKDITAEDLEKISPDVFEARLAHFEAQKAAIEQYVQQAVLDGLAEKAKLSTDEFMAKESEKAQKSVSEKDVAAFLKERNVSDPSKVPENVRNQIKGMLHMQKLVASSARKNPVDLYMKRPRSSGLAIKHDGEAFAGGKDAKVVVTEFSDFQCPYCSRAADTVKQLKKHYGNKIKVVFKHLPLPMHPDARPASEASMCLWEQGPDKFWKFHDEVFANQQKMKEEDLKAYAKKSGGDMAKFEACLAQKKYADHVRASESEARKLRVNATPTFFVNGQPVKARGFEDFQEVIDEELAL